MLNNVKYYKKITKEKINYKIYLKSFFQAFFFGGLICLFGQIIYNFLLDKFSINEAKSYLLMIFMSIAALLTGIGIYDEIGQIAKCGLAIPITGFANSCVSTALEYRKEGLVAGIGSNLFKLAGSVIIYGTISAVIVSILRYFFGVIL